MKGTKNSDGTYTLENGTVVDEMTYNEQLTEEDKAPPAAPATNPLELKLLILEEENRKYREALNTPKPPPAANPDPPLGEGDVFNKPEMFLSRIDKMIKDQIAPLKASQAAFDKQQAYGALKQKLKAQNPQSAQAFGMLEPLIDQFMEGREPTEANFAECLQRAIGAAALSSPSFFSRTPTNAPDKPADKTVDKPINGQPPMIPPHLRPSQPAARNDDPNKPIDMSQFDENEKRLMRENRQNPKQYLLMRDTPAEKLLTKEFQDAYKKAGE